MTAGKSSEKDAKKKRNHQKGLKKTRDVCEKVAKEEIGRLGIVGKVREIINVHEKVAKEEIGRLGIVQEILRKSSDFLSVPALKHHQNSTKRPQEGRKERILRRGKKKARNFGRLGCLFGWPILATLVFVDSLWPNRLWPIEC